MDRVFEEHFYLLQCIRSCILGRLVLFTIYTNNNNGTTKRTLCIYRLLSILAERGRFGRVQRNKFWFTGTRRFLGVQERTRKDLGGVLDTGMTVSYTTPPVCVRVPSVKEVLLGDLTVWTTPEEDRPRTEYPMRWPRPWGRRGQARGRAGTRVGQN